MNDINFKSSKDFIDVDYVLDVLNVRNLNSFMDIGCGDGHVAIEASKLNKDASIYAVDQSDDVINYLNSKIIDSDISNIEIIQSEVDKHIDCEDNKVDLILMINVFHELITKRDKYNAISECSRVLNDNGKIAIIEFKKVPTYQGPPMKLRLSHNELEDYLSKQDFQLIYLNESIGKYGEEGYSHYLSVFKKK
ncbi:hypothetical protein BGI41_02880 [Methanobrevibacter sp. 87.7]|uniref:class I SAM-dependent methyltransferase n=1 Tax=Methanobrevibacter sp. 87.7 TaxID=387957 RepID=UPI000B5146C4|nr:class I SAM-dependent methyltransferase [Methanobrevibacter sp. 87.7]OWT33347.1 hypothetical protein BGI41_02880 [Methanobrevibacter sp. 87.7]